MNHHIPSNLLGPEVERVRYPSVGKFLQADAHFWDIVERFIVEDFEGAYEDLPWEFTEDASEVLAEN